MALFQTCPYCGSNIDFGETCDCTKGNEANTDHEAAAQQPGAETDDTDTGKK